MVAELASGHGLWVVEDDPYAELRYRDQASAPLAAQPGAAGRVIHLGSFPKIVPRRCGWAGCAPPPSCCRP